MSREERENQFGSYRIEMQKIVDEFNEKAGKVFRADKRVLAPAEGPYGLDKRGIIVEHQGRIEDFEKDFEEYSDEIYKFAHKLDKRTRLYEYPFVSEFGKKDKWIEHNNQMVAYNFEL